MRKRWAFLVRAMSEGLRWAGSVLNPLALGVTLAAVLVGVVMVGVLLERPAWLSAGMTVLAAFAIFFEGAYRVWQEADNAAGTAQGELGPWLDERGKEIQVLAERLREKIGHGPVADVLACGAIEQSFWKVSGDVLTRLHIDAPEWVEYYCENPPDVALQVTPIKPEQFEERAKAMDFTVDQIEHIRVRLK